MPSGHFWNQWFQHLNLGDAPPSTRGGRSVHAASKGDGWADFLRAFSEWASKRSGIPLFNQSPFITKPMVQLAFSERWTEFSYWVRSVDPDRRLLNPYFEEILE